MMSEVDCPVRPSSIDLQAIQDSLHKIYESILGVAVDLDDSFILIGGDSLKALRIKSQFDERWVSCLSVSKIFEFATIKNLAAHLSALGVFQNKEECSIRQWQRDEFPLGDSQKSFYFSDWYHSGCENLYNVPLILDINGSLDIERILRCLNDLKNKHEILRTIFIKKDSRVFQKVLKKGEVKITADVKEVNSDNVSFELSSWLGQYISLNEPPLLKVAIFKINAFRYVLALNQPHIITDGWSLRTIGKEIFDQYLGYSPQHQVIKAPHKSYFDFLDEKGSSASLKQKAKDLKYWELKLGEFQDLKLPCDYRREEKENFQGTRCEFLIDREYEERIIGFAAKYKVTPFALIATVLNLLLSKYCGQEDVILGIPVSTRTSGYFNKALGPFLNTLVLKNSVRASSTFAQLLSTVKENIAEACDHGSVSFNELVSHLKVKREVNKNPIFQVMLVWQDWWKGMEYSTTDFSIEPKHVDLGQAKFDLTFEFVPTNYGIKGFFEYKNSLFCGKSLQILIHAFLDLLNYCLENPLAICQDIPLGGGDLKSQTENSDCFEKALLGEANTVVDFFEKSAQKNPSRVAITYREQSLTYAGLNKSANQLASYLMEEYKLLFENNEHQPLIGVFLDKGIELIIAILAILKMGSAYVPIDRKSPKSRVNFILENSSCKLVLTNSRFADIFDKSDNLFFLDEKNVEIQQFNPKEDIDLVTKAMPEDLMYVIYTSGTTGQPKGVLQTHANVVRLFLATKRIFNFNDDDAVLFFHSHAFDFSVWEMWSALMYGARLVIPNESEIIDPADLRSLILRENISVLNQTPSAFQGFMRECLRDPSEKLPLRTVIFGGEALDIHVLRQWWQYYDDASPMMVNMYGITETTVHTTYKILSKADLARREVCNIGQPLDDMFLAIVDRNLISLPDGFPGEILVGGNGLAKGYLKLPDLTSKKFITTPVSRDRFYRTGDLGRRLADGSFEYLGRTDSQLKFRGFRIESAGIESVLRTFPGILQCAVTVQQSASGTRLVAYYVPSNADIEISSEEMRKFLLRAFPSYMVPSSFFKIENMPLTTNMKIDYQKLVTNNAFVDRKTIDVDADLTDIQKKLISIWSKNLNKTVVDIDANFFSLGGDSIIAVNVVTDSRGEGLFFRVSDLFKYQTIRELACSYSSEKSDRVKVHRRPPSLLEVDIECLPVGSVEAYPISYLQLGMIYHTNYKPDSAFYVDVFRYTISSHYCHGDFLKSLEAIIHSNPLLRTTFNLSDYSEPLQIVWDKFDLDVVMHDVSNVSDLEQETILSSWVESEKKKGFRFDSGPLFRFAVYILSDQCFEFCFSFHHSILDGWSVANFLVGLLKTYNLLLKGEEIPKTIHDGYKQYVYLEREMARSVDQKNFWVNELEGFSFTNIPKWSAALTTEDSFSFCETKLNDELSSGLSSFSKKLGVSIDVVFLSALLELLKLLSGSDDILVGAVFNGRPTFPGSSDILGLFLNTLPFRHNVLDDVSWEEFILSVSAKKSKIYPYRRYPLSKIQDDLKINKLFDVIFYFTHFYMYEELASSEGAYVSGCKFYERTNFPLAFNCTIDSINDSIGFRINYDACLYSHQQIKIISSYFVRILTSVLLDVSKLSAKSVRLFDCADREKLLFDWNDTGINYDFIEPFHIFFENQISKFRNSVALSCGDSELSYGELGCRIDTVARRLAKTGVYAGDYVALYFGRRLDSVICMLAIFKLGCIYVPIDVENPAERVRFMIERSGCRAVITEGSLIDKADVFDAFKGALLDIDKLYYQSLSGATFPPYSSALSDTAYLMYTSGSTGRPKGVMVSHHSLINFLVSMKTILQFSEKDSFLALTSFSFDISLLEILLPLFSGGRCVISEQGQNRDPSWIIGTVDKKDITFVQATPTMWRMLLDYGYQPSEKMTVLVGGEALQPEVAKQLLGAGSAWNVYGPTEATIWATCLNLKKSQRLSIGKPIANTKLYVVDEDFEPVPIGFPGELCISGFGVAQGYLAEEEKTKNAFIPNPFVTSDECYQFLYRTGDLVRWMPNGEISYIGRTDRQIKLRGFRIEPGEIQSVLLKHQLVKDCFVTVESVDNFESLVAYVSIVGDNLIPQKELRIFLSKVLPYYMIPDKFIYLDNVPVNVSGKLDVSALMNSKALSDHSCQSNTAFVPLNPLEEKISEIWKEVLQVDYFLHDSNFYDEGGNSISSLIVLQKINEKFSLNISIRDMALCPTLSKLADLVEKYRDGVVESETFSFSRNIIDPVITLKKSDSKNVIFLIHPVGGAVFYYFPLVKRLKSDWTVYAIQDPALESQDTIFFTLEEMATFYIDVIKRYQNVGPYFIAGSSFGANTSVEIARQLILQGESVNFVGLFDGWLRYPEKANNDKEWFGNNLKKQLQQLQGLLPRFEIPKLLLDIHWHRQQLLVQYEAPKNLDVNMVLFKAAETMKVFEQIESKYNNWELCCRVPPETHTVPGDHFTMHFEPHVDKFAEILDTCLKKIEIY